MRTLDELLKVAREAEAAYKARVEAAKQEQEKTQQAIYKAQADASAAAKSGDEAAYAAAKHAEDFARERLKVLRGEQVAPYYTPEQHNAIVQEANSVYMADTKQLYKRLYELAKEWEAVQREIIEKGEQVRRVGLCLDRSRLASWEIDRMRNDERPFEPNDYKTTYSGGMSEELKIMKHGIYARISEYYTPEKGGCFS